MLNFKKRVTTLVYINNIKRNITPKQYKKIAQFLEFAKTR